MTFPFAAQKPKTGVCEWHLSFETNAPAPCPVLDVVPIKIRQPDGSVAYLGDLCVEHAIEWDRTHITPIKEPSVKIFEMPPIPRDAFPDEETYQKAVETSQSDKRATFTGTGQDYTGIPDDKIVEVFRALVDAAEAAGMGFLQDGAVGPFSLESAQQWWDLSLNDEGTSAHFDYVVGRPIKTVFTKDADGTWHFNSRFYERDQQPAGPILAAVFQEV